MFIEIYFDNTGNVEAAQGLFEICFGGCMENGELKFAAAR